MTDSKASTGSATTIELEAAAFRALVAHLRKRNDVQNIDMMNLTGFCRNCLSTWYQEADNAAGGTLTKESARALIYGMPYGAWQALNQTEASADQKAAYAAKHAAGHEG